MFIDSLIIILIAAEIADKVMIGTGKWSDLFAKHDFFRRYRSYLQIIASSNSPERQLKWFASLFNRLSNFPLQKTNISS